jgi:transcription antitermination factor NusG
VFYIKNNIQGFIMKEVLKFCADMFGEYGHKMDDVLIDLLKLSIENKDRKINISETTGGRVQTISAIETQSFKVNGLDEIVFDSHATVETFSCSSNVKVTAVRDGVFEGFWSPIDKPFTLTVNDMPYIFKKQHINRVTVQKGDVIEFIVGKFDYFQGTIS